jgi:protein-disulfide isomerase
VYVSKKTWIIFGIIVIGLLTALVIASRNANPQIDVSKIDQNVIQTPSAANGNIADHAFGLASSKVILIEYGDYQCPGCGGIYPHIKSISEAYSGQLAFVFRNFPLTTIHANARAAAAAAEAAGLNGKFWEMHNILYENQTSWETLTGNDRTNAFVGYATSVGINKDKFIASLADNNVNQKISYDQAIAKKISVDSTPTFYLDGVKLDSAIWGDESKLSGAINTELKKVGIIPPAFTPSAQ